MLRVRLLAGTAMLVLMAGPLAAAEIDVTAPIESVVVYPLGANVTRTLPFEVPEGESTLVIGDLPNGFDVATLRIDGVAEGGLEIRTVDSRTVKQDLSDDPERIRLEEAIQAVRDQLAQFEDRMTALQAERTFIQNLIAEGPRGFADQLANQGGGIDQWSNAWHMIGDGLGDVVERIRDVTVNQRAANEELADLQAELAALPAPRTYTEVRIDVAAASAASGTLKVSYQVANARWTPAYDAMLDTGSGGAEASIELIRRAEITQSSGEDWTNVALTLSTTRPAGGTQAPMLSPSQVQYFTYYYGRDGIAASGVALADEAARSPAPPPPPVAQMQAVADFGDFKADFIVPVPVSVTSGAGSRSVRLATDEAPVRLYVEAVPRLSEQAFLTAAFDVLTEAPILAGRATLFRDGAFVGSGQLAFTSPGDEVRLGFGADDQVRVTWTVVDQNTGVGGFLTRINTQTIHYQINVTNGHSIPIEITAIDRIPYSEDQQIVVTRLPETTPPTEEDVDGQRGILAWSYDYDPGESRAIDIVYQVTWPGDQSIMGAE